jgi:predicted nuclease with RNAse H fold
MLILGLDAAADLKRCGYVLAWFRDGVVDLTDAGTLDSSQNIEKQLAVPLQAADRALIAIDAPLGWPLSLGQALIEHRAGQEIIQPPNELFRRETDRYVRRHIGKQSLDVGADRIARAAWSALDILGQLRELVGQPLPLAWSPDFPEKVGVIEVYPAATLAAWGRGKESYKKPDQVSARRRITDCFRERASWLGDLAEGSVDVFDAGLCVIAACDFLEGAAPGPEDRQLAEREGWIWVRVP